MKVDISFAFPSGLQARAFVAAEKIICYGYSRKKNMLRCLCTRAQAETAVKNYRATLLDVHPVLPPAMVAAAGLKLFG